MLWNRGVELPCKWSYSYSQISVSEQQILIFSLFSWLLFAVYTFSRITFQIEVSINSQVSRKSHEMPVYLPFRCKKQWLSCRTFYVMICCVHIFDKIWCFYNLLPTWKSSRQLDYFRAARSFGYWDNGAICVFLCTFEFYCFVLCWYVVYIHRTRVWNYPTQTVLLWRQRQKLRLPTKWFFANGIKCIKTGRTTVKN